MGDDEGREARHAPDCDLECAFKTVFRDFGTLGFFGRVSGRDIRRSSSHCFTATSSSSPLRPSVTKPAIFAHRVSSMEGIRFAFVLPLLLSFSLPSESPSLSSLIGELLTRLRTLRRFPAVELVSLTLSLAIALAPGRKRQSG